MMKIMLTLGLVFGIFSGSLFAQSNGRQQGVDTMANEEPKKTVFSFADLMPVFDGDMMSWIAKQIQYPADARANEIQGKVIVQFIVREDGQIDPSSIQTRGNLKIGFGLEEEAIRIIKLMPPWKPGIQGGKPVAVMMVLPIMFQLK